MQNPPEPPLKNAPGDSCVLSEEISWRGRMFRFPAETHEFLFSCRAELFLLSGKKYRESAKSAEITSHIKNFLKEYRKKIAFFGEMCYNS